MTLKGPHRKWTKQFLYYIALGKCASFPGRAPTGSFHVTSSPDLARSNCSVYAGTSKTKMAYTWLRWPAFVNPPPTNSIAAKTEQAPVENFTQPNAPPEKTQPQESTEVTLQNAPDSKNEQTEAKDPMLARQTNLIASKTEQVPVEKSFTQPNAPAEKIQAQELMDADVKNAPDSNSKIEQTETKDSAVNSVKQKEKRNSEGQKRRRKRRKEAQREKKKMAVKNQMLEMLSKVGGNVDQLNNLEKQKFVSFSRRAAKAAAKTQREQVQLENTVSAKVSDTQANLQELVEAEKQRAEKFLSIARKYHDMWKTLNDQLKSTSKSQKEDSTCHVRSSLFFFSIP